MEDGKSFDRAVWALVCCFRLAWSCLLVGQDDTMCYAMRFLLRLLRAVFLLQWNGMGCKMAIHSSAKLQHDNQTY